MTTRLLLAPVGAGKTESILRHIARTLDSRPFAKVWVLLATRRQEDALRQRMVEDARQVYFNVEFFNFYELYQRLLDMAGMPFRQLGDSARFALLRTITTRLQPDLEVYGTIAHTPGFIHVMADFIYELKQSSIYPADFAVAAQTARDRDLARIYAEYQQTLQVYDLVDTEGQGWLARNALQDDLTLAGDLAALLVDGFDQFTPVQADLLALLADRTEDALITLTAVEGREATVGRRFDQALKVLTERLHQPFIEQVNREVDNRHPDLKHLIDQVFRRDAPQRESSSGIRLIEAPNPADEVGAVLRTVKRLLLEGVPPDDVLVVLRDWERYRVHFSRYSRKYGLPLALHYGEPLAENPAIIALYNLITLHESDFRRRDLLDVLRSQYILTPQFSSEDVDLLEKISLRLTVTGGRDLWLEAIRQASQPATPDLEDYDDDDFMIDTATAARLREALIVFFEAVTPPPTGTLKDYIAWVEERIGEDVTDDPDDDPDPDAPLEDDVVRMVDRLREATVPDAMIARDLAAMNEFKHVLWGLLHAQELLQSIDPMLETTLDWETFSAELTTSLELAKINPRPNRSGRVLVTTATDARGLPHKHVFILGLSEGLFPAQISEDPLYLDSERRGLQQRLIPLQTRAERRADDGLFYELVCLPRESLVLSRPTLQDGKPWLESPLWRAVRAIFSDAGDLVRRDRIGIGQVVPLEYVATPDEAAISVAAALSAADANVWPALNWLRQQGSWTPVQAGRAIEMRRMNGHDEYSGVLRDPALIDIVARKLSPARVWSASQLNDYGVCGFRFFAKRLLKLEELEEPEEGLDAAQRGTLNHEILERTYRRLHEMGLPIHSDYIDQAVETLHDVADHVFAEAPRTIGFREAALWEQEQGIIRRKLERLLRLDFSEDSPLRKKFGSGERRPYRLEAAFGMDDTVTIPLGEGEGLRVRGIIDRVDLLDGRGAVVIDYKSGSTSIKTEEMTEGRNFQMMVYLEAAQLILNDVRVAGGLFWHISDQSISGQLDLEKGTAPIESAKEHIRHNLARGRKGDFATQPNKPENDRCVRYCEFRQLCRMR